VQISSQRDGRLWAIFFKNILDHLAVAQWNALIKWFNQKKFQKGCTDGARWPPWPQSRLQHTINQLPVPFAAGDKYTQLESHLYLLFHNPVAIKKEREDSVLVQLCLFAELVMKFTSFDIKSCRSNRGQEAGCCSVLLKQSSYAIPLKRIKLTECWPKTTSMHDIRLVWHWHWHRHRHRHRILITAKNSRVVINSDLPSTFLAGSITRNQM